MLAVGSVPARVWRGKTLVVVADSHMEGQDKAGWLLANYTGCPVVTATRQVWARDRVLVAASAAIYRGGGRLVLAPAAPADGRMVRTVAGGGGRPPVRTELGSTLPAGSVAPVWPGVQQRVLPAVNRTTGPAGPDPDDLRPGVVLSAQARWVWENSQRTPSGYSFYGREWPAAERMLVLTARYAALGGALVLDLHAGVAGFEVAGRTVRPEVLAEVVAALRVWTGQQILLPVCNGFDNTSPDTVFHPVAQLFVRALQARSTGMQVRATVASAIVREDLDGRLYVVSELRDGGFHTFDADWWWELFADLPPVPLGPTHLSGGRSISTGPAGVPPVRVPGEPGPSESWPVRPDERVGWADGWAVELALPPGAYGRLLDQLRAAGVPEDQRRDWCLVALLAYNSDPDRYETQAAAGDRSARSILRAAAAGYTALRQPAGRWVTPGRSVTDQERAFGAAIGALPAPAAGDPGLIVVGMPGQPVPGFAFDHVPAMLDPNQPGARVLVVGRASSQRLHQLARQLGSRAQVFHLADQDRALADPAGALAATDQWTPVPGTTLLPAPGTGDRDAWSAPELLASLVGRRAGAGLVWAGVGVELADVAGVVLGPGEVAVFLVGGGQQGWPTAGGRVVLPQVLAEVLDGLWPGWQSVMLGFCDAERFARELRPLIGARAMRYSPTLLWHHPGSGRTFAARMVAGAGGRQQLGPAAALRLFAPSAESWVEDPATSPAPTAEWVAEHLDGLRHFAGRSSPHPAAPVSLEAYRVGLDSRLSALGLVRLEDIDRDGDCYYRSWRRAMVAFGGEDYLRETVYGGRDPSVDVPREDSPDELVWARADRGLFH